MKCTTCSQTDFQSIHGRVFCANCGVQAAERLARFQPQTPAPQQPAPKIDSQPQTGQVLDLSATITQSQQPPEAEGPAILDLSQASQQQQAIPAQNLHRSNGYTPAKARLDQPAPTPQTTAPTPQEAVPASAPERPAPIEATPSSSGPSSTTAPQQVTHMQPHQTYSIKDTPEDYQPTTETIPASPQESLADLNMFESEQTPGPETAVQPTPHRNQAKPSSLRGFFANRFWRTGTIAISMIVLAGYITYLNYPNIALQIAANRAGINANMPGYLPDGYSFGGPIAHGSGQIIISFQGDEDQSIALKKSETRWDSRSLLRNKIQLESSTYDTYRENGLTIYTYDDRYAAWVNNGMLYEIESESPIDAGEIVQMASSL